MAKTFGLLGITTFAHAGATVDWRGDLYAAITSRAQFTRTKAGTDALFWLNDADRWGEGSPALATCYMIHALKHLYAHLP
jgi:hypothetical protein